MFIALGTSVTSVLQVLIDETLWDSHNHEITLQKPENLQNHDFLIEFWHFFRFSDTHKIFPSKPKCLVFSVSQSLLGISRGKKLSNAHNCNWVGIGLKFSGFASFNDPYQLSKFEANWRLSIPDLRWSWLG